MNQEEMFVTTYHPNGKKKGQGHLYHDDYDVNVRPVGKWTFWFADGELNEEGSFDKNGKKIGDWIIYCDDATIFANYNNDEITWNEVWPNGNKKLESQYNNKGKIGKWTSWYESGNIEYEEFYKTNRFGSVLEKRNDYLDKEGSPLVSKKKNKNAFLDTLSIALGVEPKINMENEMSY